MPGTCERGRADELPADTGGIAARVRVDEEAGDGAPAKSFKEFLCGGSGGKDVRYAVSLLAEAVEDSVLLVGRGLREGGVLWERALGKSVESGEALAKDLLLVLGKADESTIDKIDNAGFMRSRSVVRGNDSSCDGINLGSLLGSKKFQLRRRSRFRRVTRMVCGGQKRGPIRRKPCGAESGPCTQKKCATVEFLGHR